MGRAVADRLIDEIIAAGWPVGEVLGSEDELLARVGVSRSILREAVRILESQSVAYGRRGRGGGLVVTAPDPGVSVNAMALYLEYKGFSAHDLLVVRDAVELGCLDRVAARMSEPSVKNALCALHAANAQRSPEIAEVPNATHVELSELSGNPVLSVFLNILTTLWNWPRNPGW